MGESEHLLPSLNEQIAWLQERVADAEMLRRRFVATGNISSGHAKQDAAMWQAVLLTLLTVAELATELDG
jgi:hypothetical protein